ncbi:HlyD family efflux transporter periplasmic adaptor subunit [Scytonema sp. UIC 10036]|uniref:ABC exporter membrane fusion protein n=1 Tax=Scytonema sp. UIC 10036 TaxID=2304196 RepID=UPI0012DA79A5|nr:ABC exporter membrane fusion protein [Scytonema sp. UIC 10036]MUG99625.1 HlyD family efflux transporter periplasmic adaptor subunit [Scytonema sp. UIC 10036]
MAEDKESRFLEKPSNGWRIILAPSIVLAILIISIPVFSRLWYSNQTVLPKPRRVIASRVAITALGRLEPQGGVTQLSAPSSLTGNQIEKLLVKEGDTVRAGQIVAFLQGYVQATAALNQAQSKVEVARAQLAQVKAGAKPADIKAQKAVLTRLDTQLKGEVATQRATIARLQAQLNNAQTENERYQNLYTEGAISASIADSKSLEFQTLKQQLAEAEANLNKSVSTLTAQIEEAKAKLVGLNQVRSVDIQVAQAELKSAMTAVMQARAERDLSYVTSPINGKILKVHTKTGEVIGNSGIVEIGNTSQMYVVAEVYQTDIKKVRLGQKATITSPAFSKRISGTVSKIGLQVSKQSILSLNPGVDTNRRVIKVKIRIDRSEDSQQVADLTNLQVYIAIQV